MAELALPVAAIWLTLLTPALGRILSDHIDAVSCQEARLLRVFFYVSIEISLFHKKKAEESKYLLLPNK